MKVTFETDGSISVDVSPNDTPDAIRNYLGAVQSLAASKHCSGANVVASPAHVAQTAITNIRPARRRPPSLNSLNKTQYEMWEFLVDHDCQGGIHRSAVEQHFGLSYSCAGQRLGRLVRAGFAYRVGLGYFRPKTGEA
jgi:hypothetical protein